MKKFAFLSVLFPAIAAANGEYCLPQYKRDFDFSKNEYVTDMANGLAAEVRWGPHGYVGAILQPRVGDRDRVPVERFSTFYRALNCQWKSVEVVWEDFTESFVNRANCQALVFGDNEAIFQCGHLLESFWLDQDVLGPFQKYEFRGTGPWYQSEEYLRAKDELNRLATQAVSDMHTALVDATSMPACESTVDPDLIELSEADLDLPTNVGSGVQGSVTFTVGIDGTVNEILLGQTAEYLFEYVMALSARNHRFPEQSRRCRAAWTRLFR